MMAYVKLREPTEAELHRYHVAVRRLLDQGNHWSARQWWATS